MEDGDRMNLSPGTIRVGGLTLNQEDMPNELDVLWTFSEVSGWHDGASVEFDSQPRTSHGQFPQAGRRGGRAITVKGDIVGPDRAQTADALDELTACLADGSFGRFDFHDVDQGWRWAIVQLAATPDAAWATETHVSFQIQFFAPDATRYGQTSTATTGFAAASGSGMVFDLFPGGVMDFGPLPSSGATSVQNPGTAPASPVFTVKGPAPDGFVITDVATGRRNSFLGPVPEGSTLTLDGSDGSVLLDGVADRLGDALIQGWPTVAPLSTAKFLFEPLGAATAAELTTAVTATYW